MDAPIVPRKWLNRPSAVVVTRKVWSSNRSRDGAGWRRGGDRRRWQGLHRAGDRKLDWTKPPPGR